MATASRGTAAAIAALLVLSGCSDGDDDSDDNRTSVSWLETDVCALVDADEVTSLIGDEATAQPGNTNPRRPECTWEARGSKARLVLRLWQPPVPRTLSDDAKRTVAVGNRTGYVEAEGKGSCTMHVEAEPAWLSVDIDGMQASRAQPCDELVATADGVLADVQ